MRMKKTSRKQLRILRRRRLALALVGAMAMPMMPALAQSLPSSGNVVNGSATINQAGSSTTITQTTKGAIIDWGSFNIGAGYGVTFDQQFGASSVTLNRVVGFGYGSSASQINGTLTSNGNVFIINPAGITFGSNAQVNVGGLVASALWMNSGDFINGLATGQFVFTDFNGDLSATHQVRNNGTITAGAGGVGLVGQTVRNGGSITSNGGNIVAGAGTQVTVDMVGDGLTQVTINVPPTVDSAVIQDRFGSMTADGGKILLRTAATAGGTGGAIYASGTLRAQSIANVNGRIELTSVGGPVMVGAPGIFSDANSPFTEGMIDVSGGPGETGGSVLIQGNGVSLVNNDGTPANPTDPLSVGSMINASGDAGGGRVDIQSSAGVTMLGLSRIFADSDFGTAGQVRVAAVGDVFLQGDISAASKIGDGGSVGLLSTTGNLFVLGTVSATGANNGGSVSMFATNGGLGIDGVVSADGGAGNGGQVTGVGGTVILAEASQVSADGGLAGGLVGFRGSNALVAYGLLSAHGGTAGGSIGTATDGTFDIRGLLVDAGSTRGAAGSWTLSAPTLTAVNGAAVGGVGAPVLGTDVQDADINHAFLTGTSVVLQSADYVQFDDAQIVAANASPLSFSVNAQGAIVGNAFSIGSIGGTLEMVFNANASSLNNGNAGINFNNATLDSNGGNIAMYGQSDPVAGTASNYNTGIALAGSTISTGGGNVLIRGSSTGADAGFNDAGVVLDGVDIDAGSGAIDIYGLGADATSGVSLQGSDIDSAGGNIDVQGEASGSGVGIDLTDALLTAGAGDIRLFGSAALETGVHFGGQSGVSTTTGDISITGIGTSIGLDIGGGDLSTDSGHIDLRGRGTSSGAIGLRIGQGVDIATNGGGIELSGQGNAAAGLVIGDGASVDAGDSLIVLRATSTGATDTIDMRGSIHSGVGVNLRPGGVDLQGQLTEATADTIYLGSGTGGFVLSNAELALIDTPELIIGSNLQAGAIQVLGGINREGDLTLQNGGGSGGISIQAALDVGDGTLALSSGGSITQASAGVISAHSLLAQAGGDVLLATALNDVANTTLAGSAGGDFKFQDANTLAIASVSATGFDASAGQLSRFSATGISAGGDAYVRNLQGDLTLNAGVTAANIDLVTAGRLQNVAGASLVASGDWRVWANTWVGETRGGLAGDGNLPNLYGCAYLGACGVTVPGVDNHFIYVQQPIALISFNNATREYGLPNPLFTFSVTGAMLGDTAANVASGSATTTATIGNDVGNYAITGNFLSAAGYRIQFVPGTLAITPATLLFTADGAVRYLGFPNPDFSGTVTGFRNGDTVASVFGETVIWSSPAGPLAPIGFYPVIGGASARNYVFAQANSNVRALQIIPLPQLPATPIEFVRETLNTYVYDRNFGGAPVCAVNASIDDTGLASTGDGLSTEWTKVRSRPNLTNCFDSERENGCGSF